MATKNKPVAVKKAAPVAVQKQKTSAEQFTVKVNEAARIKSGKYAGLVGTVEAITQEINVALVHIQGVRDGEKIDVKTGYAPADLEPNK